MSAPLLTARVSAAAFSLVVAFAAAVPAQPVTEAWVDRYDGTKDGVGGTDRGFDVAFDSQGNTLVAGFSAETDGSGGYLVIKYAPDGTRIWLRPTAAVPLGLARALTVDPFDDIVVVGNANAGDIGGPDFGVMKMSAAGNVLWHRTYDVGGGSVIDNFEEVVTDSQGNIYAHGTQLGTSSVPSEFHVVKYAPDGTFQWGHLEIDSFASAIAVTDAAVYVVGGTEAASNDDDVLVMKMTPAGAVEWRRTYGRTALFANDGAVGVAFDPAGNIVVGGSYSGNGGGAGVSTDMVVLRIQPDGTLISETVYDGPLGVYNVADAFGVDSAGNAFIAGRQNDPSDPSGTTNVQVVKIDPAGNALWDRSFGGLAAFTEIPRDVAVDHLGAVYVAGETWSPGPIREYFTLKYEPDGVLGWAQLYGGEPNDPSYALSVAVSADRRVSVTGYSGAFGPFGGSDVATVHYSQPAPVSVTPALPAAGTAVLRAAPNPFGRGTTVSLSLAEARFVELDVLDVAGRRVRTLGAGRRSAGEHVVAWNGRDDAGRPVPAGVYFVRVADGAGDVVTRKVTRLD